MNVEIVLFPGFDELDAIGPFEVFANASRLVDECNATLVTYDDSPYVWASHGLRVSVDAELGATDPDLVVVPGGGWNERDAPGARLEAESDVLPRELADFYDRGVRIASVCTGAMLLAAAGLLDGVPATTHRTALEDLSGVADVRDARVVDAGDLITAGGVTSGIDMAFHVVSSTFGSRVADAIATEREYDPSDDLLVV